jgi:hypothetical protein
VEIANKETEAGQQDATAKYFRQQADNGQAQPLAGRRATHQERHSAIPTKRM